MQRMPLIEEGHGYNMNQHTSEQQKYERTQMQRELVIQKLKEQGCRITKQRMILLDIILNDNCSSCKEIYYKASKLDHKIGTATVYRMVNTLEEIGAISRHNMYRIDCSKKTEEQTYDIELDDHTIQSISESTLNNVLQAGLKACGYIDDQSVKGLILQPSVC